MNIVDYLIFKDFIFPILIIIFVIMGFLINSIRLKIKYKKEMKISTVKETDVIMRERRK